LPVPVSDTCCGLFGALSVKVTSPVRTPVLVGVKVTLMMQLPPAATVLPLTQGVTVLVALSVTSAKSPLIVMVLIFSVALPVLVSVTVFDPLLAPTTFMRHFNDVGDRVASGPPPPPPARALIRALPFGLPQPVTKS